ncbi:hypothetical protein HII12_005226 [Brettanomyces bruxellensis]|uniref:Dihydrofolate synthetase n=1 Tax=Dekkera bruxellensis TaxID=5007 RepID=A0A8H6B6C9_DEKBR|nr:hypothetical protein HII12_005226 [Brettanomyces bruxellensis]
MPIHLGLTRVLKLLKALGNPHLTGNFKAIHVAGTNGKGSICNYLSHILTASNITNGRFTSPHLLTRSDSIQINDIPIDPKVFQTFENQVIDTDRRFSIGCTEFELLTCVAFEVFKEKKVEIAIFEVGVGGRLDATNVLQSSNLLCTGVAKIGMDHQKLLGNTIEEIATQKLGIMKQGIPCVIDGTNVPAVLELARKRTSELHSKLYEALIDSQTKYRFGLYGDFKTPLHGKYQQNNLSVALRLLDIARGQGFANITKDTIAKGLEETKWPGRLDEFDLRLPGGNSLPVLLDGAHNINAVTELIQYLDESYRVRHGGKHNSLIYVMAVKKDKNIKTLFKKLFKPNDNIIFTTFNENIEGMPWVRCTQPKLLKEEAAGTSNTIVLKPTLNDALDEAYNQHFKTGKDVVICGSLYLVSDVLRYHVANGGVISGYK